MNQGEPEREIAGRYRLEAELGGGTFGRVFQALDLNFQPSRRVAVKLLREQFANDANVREQFVREASSLASFNHPNILSVYDFGVTEKTAYLVTPLAENGSLAGVIKRQGRLSIDQAGRYLEQMAEAIEYSHSRKGLIHRDLKPQNILLDETGRLLVADLGLARIVEGSSSAMLTDLSSGTPAYMAPEQWQGHVGRPNDIYALGIILFEMLTGTRPFKGNQFELMGQHLNSPPPSLKTFVPDLPASLDKVIEQILAKDPKARPRHATELVTLYREATQPYVSPATALELPYTRTAYEVATTPLPTGFTSASLMAVATPPPVLAEPVPAAPLEIPLPLPAEAHIPPKSKQSARSKAKARVKKKKRGGLFFSLALLLLLVGGGAVFLNFYSFDYLVSYVFGDISAAPMSTTHAPTLVLNSHNGNVTQVGFDAANTTLFSIADDQKLRLWNAADLKDQEADATIVLQTKEAHPVAINRQQTRLIAVGDGNQVRLISTETGKELNALTGFNSLVSGLAFTNEGKTLVVADTNGSLTFWAAESGKEERPALATGQTGPQTIAISPDGTILLSGDSLGQLKIFDLADQKEVATIAAHGQAITAVAFSPTDSLTAISVSEDHSIKLWNTASFQEKAAINTASPVLSLAFSPDGKTFVTGSADNSLRQWSITERRELAIFVGHTQAVAAVAFSSDGALLISGGADATVRVWKS